MKKLVLKMVGLLCTLVLCIQLVPSSVMARDLKDIQAEIDAKKERLTELEGTINANKNNKAAAQSALSEYQEQFNALVVLIEEKEETISKRESEVDFKTDQISNTIESVQENRELFEARMRAVYEMNTTNAMMSTLFSVSSFSEVIMAADAMKRISKNDTELLEKLAENMAMYEEQKTSLEAAIATLDEELADLQADRDWAAGKMSEMQGKINIANSNIQESQAETAANEEDIKALQAEYEKVFQEQQRKSSKAGDTSVRYDGPLSWPVQGLSRVTSWFGDPRSNTGSHYGIDIPGPVGTNILAAASGTVVTATWHYSYGYYVVIDHGQGLRTLYAHNSALYVSEGAQVNTGDVISGMGNTGDSFGSHLHFEVHEHGTRQNPAGSAYLNIR